MFQSLSGRLCAGLLVAALGAPVLAASRQPQQGPGPWWKLADVQKELGLTPDQVLKIDTIWETTRPDMLQDREDLERREAILSQKISRKASEADVAMAIDRVETIRARLNKTRSLMLYRMRLAMTDDQNVKFEAMQQRWQQQNAARGQTPPGNNRQGAAAPKNGPSDTRKPR